MKQLRWGTTAAVALVGLVLVAPEALGQYERRTAIVEAVEKSREAIVTLKMMRRGNWGLKEVNGCGVVVDARGYVVTSHHVVQGCEKLSVVLVNDVELPATIVVEDPKTDLAIIRVRTDRALHELPIAPGSDLMVGETVIAIGHPYGYKNTVSTGIVSALDREVVMPNSGERLTNLIQITAAINPGNSGGALLNINGELIGINTAIRNDSQNIAFAINADTLQQVLSYHLSAGRVSQVGTGLKCRAKVESSGKVHQRLVVETVAERSPAAAAGLKAGDVVEQVGALKVSNRFDLERALWGYKEGEKVEAVVLRKGEETKVALQLCREAPERTASLPVEEKRLPFVGSTVEPARER